MNALQYRAEVLLSDLEQITKALAIDARYDTGRIDLQRDEALRVIRKHLEELVRAARLPAARSGS